MTALLIDTSHWNAVPNWPVLKSGGVAGVIGKVSEGVGYADPNFGAVRSGAEANGLALGGYHFSRLLDPTAEARWFIHCLGGRLRPGEFVGLDLEVAAAGVDPVAWVGHWLDAMAALGVPVRLLYLNKSELAGFNWAPIVARGVLLWLAAYDGQQTPVSSGAWPTLTLKQFTDRGTVPGEAGTVDVDVLFGALTDLTGGTDMPLNTADLAAVEHAVWVSSYCTIDGVRVGLAQVVRTTYDNSKAAAIDAAVTRKVVEQLAAGVTLTQAQVDAIATKAAADFAAGFTVTVAPTAPPAAS